MGQQESHQRGRGRPPKDDALSAAERARRYRAKQKAAGLMIKRYAVTVNDFTDLDNLAFYKNSCATLDEQLRQAIAARDDYKSEIDRLHAENERLWADMKEVQRYSAIKEKELIVTRDKLLVLTKKGKP